MIGSLWIRPLLDRSFQKAWRHVFAGLHRGPADQVAAASQYRLPAERQNVFALVDQQRSTRPLDFLAASECDEDQDVVGKRLDGGLNVAASEEGIKGGIFGDTLQELLDGGNAAGHKGEVERAERDVNHRDSRRLCVLLDGGSGCCGSGLFLGCSVVLRKAAAIEEGEE